MKKSQVFSEKDLRVQREKMDAMCLALNACPECHNKAEGVDFCDNCGYPIRIKKEILNRAAVNKSLEKLNQ